MVRFASGRNGCAGGLNARLPSHGTTWWALLHQRKVNVRSSLHHNLQDGTICDCMHTLEHSSIHVRATVYESCRAHAGRVTSGSACMKPPCKGRGTK